MSIVGEVVLINELLWDDCQLNTYVFWSVQWCAEVEVCKVKGGKSCIRCVDDAVEKELA